MSQTPAFDEKEQYRTSAKLDARIALHARYSTAAQPWFQWLCDHMPLPARGLVLDLGSGPASFWQACWHSLPCDCRVILTDLSPSMLAAAQSNLPPQPQLCGWLVADAQCIPLADRAVDVVIANHMLYHVPDLYATLTEIRRVLKPSGLLYASTVGDIHLLELYQIVNEFCGRDMNMGAIVRSFTLETGAAALCRHFSNVTRYSHEDSLVVPEAPPLADYILSMIGLADELRGRENELTDWLTSLFRARRGPLHITKATGLLVAS